MTSEFFEQLVTLCCVVGWFLWLFGFIGILIGAFGEHILWGFGCLIFSLVIAPIFVFLYWKKTKGSFILWVIGTILLLLGNHLKQVVLAVPI